MEGRKRLGAMCGSERNGGGGGGKKMEDGQRGPRMSKGNSTTINLPQSLPSIKYFNFNVVAYATEPQQQKTVFGRPSQPQL